jgi:hypothetical protein
LVGPKSSKQWRQKFAEKQLEATIPTWEVSELGLDQLARSVQMHTKLESY